MDTPAGEAEPEAVLLTPMEAAFDLATVEAPFFEPMTGQRFLAHFLDTPGAPPLDLELLHVQPLRSPPGNAGRAPFSLLFKTSDLARMAQGTYRFAGAWEHTPIFLVPVRDPGGSVFMEAVFN